MVGGRWGSCDPTAPRPASQAGETQAHVGAPLYHCSLSQHRGEAFAHHSPSTLISSSPSFSHPNPNPHPRALGCAATSTAGNASRCKRARRVPSARRRSHGSACCPSTAARPPTRPSPYADKYAPRGLHPCTGLLHVLYVPESRGAGQLASAGHYCKVRTLRRTRTSLATGVCSAVLPHTTSYLLPVAPHPGRRSTRAL